MSVTGIIIAAIIVGGTGLFIGVFLGFAGKKWNPTEVPMPFSTPCNKEYSFCTFVSATPRTAQFVVMSGRYTCSRSR